MARPGLGKNILDPWTPPLIPYVVSVPASFVALFRDLFLAKKVSVAAAAEVASVVAAVATTRALGRTTLVVLAVRCGLLAAISLGIGEIVSPHAPSGPDAEMLPKTASACDLGGELSAKSFCILRLTPSWGHAPTPPSDVRPPRQFPSSLLALDPLAGLAPHAAVLVPRFGSCRRSCRSFRIPRPQPPRQLQPSPSQPFVRPADVASVDRCGLHETALSRSNGGDRSDSLKSSRCSRGRTDFLRLCRALPFALSPSMRDFGRGSLVQEPPPPPPLQI
ncbi:hypothetical protein ACHAWF_014433 [Thalassiosira exigua]